MKNDKLYKYINLLLRITIGVGALWLIYEKLKHQFLTSFKEELVEKVQFEYVIIALFLFIVNWGIEAGKWKLLIQKTVPVSFIGAFTLTITGITIGLITPNRIGEIPARALLLNRRDKLKDLIMQTSVGAYSQLIVTLLLGTIAAIFILELFNLMINALYIKFLLIGITLLMVLIYFYHLRLKKVIYRVKYIRDKKWLDALEYYTTRKLLQVLMLSGLRYLVFWFQFYLLLIAFNFSFGSRVELLLIPLCFMVASLIPTILISEIGVRGSVAIFVFGVISDNYYGILSASVLLWVINVAIPSMIGLVFIKRFKIFPEH